MKSCWRDWSRHLSVMFTFHICLCPGACLFWIIKQRALSSLRLCLFFTPPPSFSGLHVFSLSLSRSSFSHSSMSVQPALAEAVALSEMQMAAFEGGTLGTSINPGVYSPERKKAMQLIVRRLFHLYCATGPCFYPLSPCQWIQRNLQRFRKHQDRHKGEEMT